MWPRPLLQAPQDARRELWRLDCTDDVWCLLVRHANSEWGTPIASSQPAYVSSCICISALVYVYTYIYIYVHMPMGVRACVYAYMRYIGIIYICITEIFEGTPALRHNLLSVLAKESHDAILAAA